MVIPTGILGLTVLAIGNSVGDWVADTAVARAGKPGMGIASCFGSPLLNDVLGLSIALMVSTKVILSGRADEYKQCLQPESVYSRSKFCLYLPITTKGVLQYF